MKSYLLILCLIIVISSKAQSHLEEINDQVWKPFLKASSEFDGELYMSLQSKEVIQASLDSKRVLGYPEYEESIVPNFKRIRNEGKVKRTTEMRFTDRITSNQFAYEKGFFKSTILRANGETRVVYAEFYMVLRKEEGKWKIFVDADAGLNGTITEEMFQAAQRIN